MRIKTSYIWALLIASLVVGWMVSDNLFDKKTTEGKQTNSDTAIKTTDMGKIEAITVNAIKVANKQTSLIVRASGVTETQFEIIMVARRSGIVKKIYVKEGNWVNPGDIILELDKGTLEADLDATQADRLAALAVYNDTQRKFGENGEIAVQLKSAKADHISNQKTYEL